MRNLKRALSLALASVMLLGMMVVGTSAKSINDFTDADEITQQEAVAIATGLGIFDGYDTGDFKPDNVVTRAEMAVIIAKILHGVDVNPSNFADAGKFTDVPEWAEGYVNLVASLGIIVGVGDGKFNPNGTVTTAEASTMLLKALGYYTDEATQLGSDWALTTTSKATTLGLYGDLALGMNDGLTRQDVAVLTFNALFAQLVAYDNNRVLYVKANDRNVVVTTGTKDDTNTLAYNTFGLYKVEGIVTANAATTALLNADNNTGAQTTVMFEDDTDLNQDGKNEYVAGDSYDFEVDTGLDMIGHAAKVYYKIEKKTPVVYAITDNAVLVETVTAGSSFSTTVKNAGFNKNTADTVVVNNYSLADTATYTSGLTTILISNSSNLTVDYAIQLIQTADYVRDAYVKDNGDDEIVNTYNLVGESTAMVDSDVQQNANVVDTIAKGDYVIVTPVDNDGDGNNEFYIVQKANTTQDTLNNIVREYVPQPSTTKLSGADTYSKSNVTVADGLTSPDGIKPIAGTAGTCTADYALIPYADVALTNLYTLVFGTDGKLVGVAPVDDGVVNYAYVAQFGTKINTDPTLNDAYALTAHIYFADGTNGVYVVDTSNTVAGNAFYGTASNGSFDFKNNDNESVTGASAGSPVNKTITPDTSSGMNALTSVADAYSGVGDFIRLYNVTIESNGKALIKELNYNVQNTSASNFSALTTLKNGVTYAGNSTSVYATTNAQADGYNRPVYTTSKTVFFYVNGDYNESGANALTVGIKTGIENAVNLDSTNGAKIAYAYAYFNDVDADNTNANGYWLVNTELIVDQTLVTTDANVYYYNGVYNIYGNNTDGYTLTYTVYDLEGNATGLTYQYGSYTDAKTAADANATKQFVKDALSNTNADKNGKNLAAVASDSTWTYRVPNNFLNYVTYGDTITMYTANNNNSLGVVATNAKVVDLTGNNLTSLAALSSYVNTINNYNGTTGYATVAYRYKTSGQAADIIYVVSVPVRNVNNQQGGNGVYAFDGTLTAANNSGALRITNSTLSKNNVAGDTTLGSVTPVTGNLTVSVSLVNGGTTVALGTQTVQNVTINSGVLKTGSNAYVDVPGFTLYTGNTYLVTVVFSNNDYTITGTPYSLSM